MLCSVLLCKKIRDEQLLGRQHHNPSLPFQTHHLAFFRCPDSYLFRVCHSNFCSLLLQITSEVVTNHMAMLWIQQVDASRTHPFLEGRYATYLGHYSCAAPEESA